MAARGICSRGLGLRRSKGMKCPHCQTDYFSNWLSTTIQRHAESVMKGGLWDGEPFYPQVFVATCPSCHGATFKMQFESTQDETVYQTIQIFPRGGSFPAAPPEVPASIRADYAEANEVLTISPKASAALSRRCLQAVLSAHGYSGRDLVKQVQSAIDESDTSKSLPISLKENIDAIRNFGNFSAHPITDQTTLNVVEVEEGEAEWCLQLLMDLFDHYYVAPAIAAKRRSALADKLASAGKPAMKS